MKRTHLRGPRLALASLAVAAAACGGSDGSPTTPPATTPVTVAPAPSPTPAAFRCPLPDMPRLNIICPRPEPVLWRQVDAAIDKTVHDHPELFNLNDDKG